MTSCKLTHFKKMVRVWKTKSLLFCLRYDPLIVFRRQNHITFIFMKTMSHDLLVQMAYWPISLPLFFLAVFACLLGALPKLLAALRVKARVPQQVKPEFECNDHWLMHQSIPAVPIYYYYYYYYYSRVLQISSDRDDQRIFFFFFTFPGLF